MSSWRIAAGLYVLMAALAWTQTASPSDDKNAAPAAPQDKTTPDQESASPYGLPPPFKPKADAPVDKSEMPPEEDKTDAPRAFTFNPVQSQRELTAGDYYFNKGNYTAAASRYEEATKWNDGNAEAWLRLGKALQKKSNAKAAREAYQKYLELSPDGKDAKDVKSRIEKLKG